MNTTISTIALCALLNIVRSTDKLENVGISRSGINVKMASSGSRIRSFVKFFETEQKKAKAFHAILFNNEVLHISSAALITNRYAIAAAGYVECFGEYPEELFIRIGLQFSKNAIENSIVHIKVHPNFNRTLSIADIAILTMNELAPDYFGMSKDMAHLAKLYAPPDANAVLYGWRFKSGRRIKSALEETQNEMLTQSAPNGPWLFSSKETQLVFYESKGGPVCRRSDGKIIGIATSINKRGLYLFTKIDFYYKTFIKHTINGFKKDPFLKLYAEDDEDDEDDKSQCSKPNNVEGSISTPLLVSS